MQTKVQYLRIILTNRCNLNCSYCHSEGISFDRSELSPYEISRLIKVCYKIGFKKFKLMGGEPTLRSDLIDIINYIKSMDNDVDLSMISNGTAELSIYKRCMTNGLNRLNISVHGWQKERFIQNTSSNDCTWKRFRENINKLSALELLNKLNYVIKKNDNEEDLFELIEWCAKNDMTVDILNILYTAETCERDSRFRYSMDEIIKLITKRFEISEQKLFSNKYSLPSTKIYLKNGGCINLKTTPLNNCKIFNACNNCPVFDYCIEGIKAIRLTNIGVVQPCLFRKDNSFNLFKRSNSQNNNIESDFKDYILNL